LSIVQHLPVGLVIVNRSYQIQFVNSSARRLLGIHRDALGEDLLHLVQNAPLRTLRNAITAAFLGETNVVPVQVGIAATAVTHLSDLEITCIPDRSERPTAEIESVILAILDTSRFLGEIRARDIEGEENRTLIAQLRSQAEQSSNAYAHLVETNEQLATLITELRGENEELLFSTESTEAAMEEVQMLNDEMQATNDELETLNEEFQATIEELNATNEAFRVRTVELQNLATSIDEQRRISEVNRDRLLAIFNGSPHALVVIGSNGETTLTNPSYQAYFGVDDPPTWFDGAGAPLGGALDPIRRAAAGEEFTEEIGASTLNGAPRQFTLQCTPIGDRDDNWRAVIRLVPAGEDLPPRR